jgi:fumarylacetoacetate (FAA) hydrolase
MKLATLRDGSRDGRLVVVSHDLTRCSDARHIAPTLQAALDDWDAAAPQLELIARGIEGGAQPVERFHERDARSPLPSAGSTAAFADPRGPLQPGASAVAAGLAAIVGDLAAGADTAAACAAIRLVMLASAATPDGGPEATAFSPVAVTPEELGPGLLVVELNGGPFSRTDQHADAGSFVAGAARARPLVAGIVGPEPTAEPPVSVPLRSGDTVRLEVRDAAGHSIFGAIEQTVA